MNQQEQESLTFQNQRVFAVAARNLLVLLEDLRAQHANNFDKLKENLPEAAGIIDMADYLDSNTYGYYRKKILDITNSARRDIEAAINHQ